MLPPEKQQLLILWKDLPRLSLTKMQELLDIPDIDIISKFYISQKIFPKKELYSKEELNSLLTFGAYKLSRQSFKLVPSFTTQHNEYFTLNHILQIILKNQSLFHWKYRNFLSCFYKFFRPTALIRCFHCRKSVENIYYIDTFTPTCDNCLNEKPAFSWKQRQVKLYRRKYKKIMSKKGFRQEDKEQLVILLRDRMLLPLLTRRRVSKIKDFVRFFSLELYRFQNNHITFRILLMEDNNGRRNQIRLERRPRSQKG